MGEINLKKIGLILAACTAVAALCACQANGQEAAAQPPPPEIEYAVAQSEEVLIWGAFTGRIAARETVVVRPRISGHIDSVNFAEGELVQQGDVLFTIDQRQYLARVQLAKAELERAQTQLDLSSSEAQRAAKLWQQRAISQEELEQRQAAVAVAQADVNASAAALQNAQIDLEYTQIKAPISGRIGRAELTRGNLATAGASLLATVVTVDPMFVYFEADQHTVEQSPPASRQRVPVRVKLGGAATGYLVGELDFVDNQYNPGTGTLQYRALVADPNHSLKPGQFARVEMPIGEASQTILLDQKAVLTDQNRRYVWVLDADNKATRRFISTGNRFDGLVVVRDGLQSGDRVVVNGLQRIVYPGMQVTPQLVEMRRPPTAAGIAALTSG